MKRKIMVIDDNPMILYSVKEGLEGKFDSYTVESAEGPDLGKTAQFPDRGRGSDALDKGRSDAWIGTGLDCRMDVSDDRNGFDGESGTGDGGQGRAYLRSRGQPIGGPGQVVQGSSRSTARRAACAGSGIRPAVPVLSSIPGIPHPPDRWPQ